MEQSGRGGSRAARALEQEALSRRRFLRAAGVGGTAGAIIAGGTIGIAGVAGASEAAAVPMAGVRAGSARSWRGSTRAALAPAAVGTPASFQTITPRRYWDSRVDGGGHPFPRATGFVFDLGAPDWFDPSTPANDLPVDAKALAINLTVTGGTAGGNLRAFPAELTTLPEISNLNWAKGQTVANYAIVADSTGPDGQGGTFQSSIVVFNASAGTVHVIIDVQGFFK